MRLMCCMFWLDFVGHQPFHNVNSYQLLWVIWAMSGRNKKIRPSGCHTFMFSFLRSRSKNRGNIFVFSFFVAKIRKIRHSVNQTPYKTLLFFWRVSVFIWFMVSRYLNISSINNGYLLSKIKKRLLKYYRQYILAWNRVK
jgi:hypothetical protein